MLISLPPRPPLDLPPLCPSHARPQSAPTRHGWSPEQSVPSGCSYRREGGESAAAGTFLKRKMQAELNNEKNSLEISGAAIPEANTPASPFPVRGANVYFLLRVT